MSLKPRITTLYIDVITLRRCDEASQKGRVSRSEFIRRAIREKIDRDNGIGMRSPLITEQEHERAVAGSVTGRTGAFRRSP